MRLTHKGATRSVGLPLPNISAFTRVFDALWGEGWGEGVTGPSKSAPYPAAARLRTLSISDARNR
jgi:hypothetical protein